MEDKENRVTCVLFGDEQELLEQWRRLNATQREAIMAFIRAFIR